MKHSLKSRVEEALLDGFEAGVDLALRETNLPLRTFPEHCCYLFIYLMMRCLGWAAPTQIIFCAILVKTGKDNFYHFSYDHLLFGDTLSLDLRDDAQYL